jgi:hypothetical protein
VNAENNHKSGCSVVLMVVRWCSTVQPVEERKAKGECYGVQLPQATVHDAAMYGDEVEWLRPD